MLMKPREGYYSEQIRNEALQSILDQLNVMQYKVYCVILSQGPCSNEDVAAYLQVPLHTVTPRTLELRQMEIVEFAGESKSINSNRKVSLWRIKPAGKQLNLFKTSEVTKQNLGGCFDPYIGH